MNPPPFFTSQILKSHITYGFGCCLKHFNTIIVTKLLISSHMINYIMFLFFFCTSSHDVMIRDFIIIIHFGFVSPFFFCEDRTLDLKGANVLMHKYVMHVRSNSFI